MRIRIVCGGGWWEVKNARCRKHDDLVVKGSSEMVYVWGGSTNPEFLGYDPAMTWKPGIHFCVLLRDTIPVSIGNGLFQPTI